jgi:hypothetical protein
MAMAVNVNTITRERVAIAGASGTGKTTFALRKYPWHRVLHCDDYIAAGDEPAARFVAEQLNSLDYECYEGVIIPLALRRWLDKNPSSIPVQRLVVFSAPKRAQTSAQRAHGRYYARVLEQVIKTLERRGMAIEIRD